MLLLLVELGIRFFSTNIVTQASDDSILLEGRFGSTPGLKPLAVGEVFSREVKVDQNGFLLNPCSSKKKRKRILFFGDSVTMGVGVDSDSSFAARLQNQYCDSLQIDNLALIGYNINDYLRIAETMQKENTLSQYDEVVVYFCLNDNFLSSAIQGSVNDASSFTSAMEWLKGKSYTYVAIKGLVADRSKAHYDFDKALYLNDTLLANLKEKIVKLKALSPNIQFVLLPYEYQLREKYNTECLPQSTLKRILSDAHVSCFDAGEYMQQSKNEDLYLYADGIHFSNRGHQLLSSLLIQNKVLFR